ncbi:hypothetical protein L596_010630 [Steinernema carpocapsae]|uniref:CS domain-containing protein n=1 Tax=Steinernema carpocapsae TaxID=34508 RepID=A0A4U5PJI5_STECR|nr:hypothetical protein L596_010630 [Steinernema carpocapsae]
MANGSESIQCYNKGCGKKFSEAENSDEACRFHPGPPYFHDAYKIWNCCKKKSTDFGTWLDLPGCTTGRHDNTKPEDIMKIVSTQEIRPEKPEDVIMWNGLNKPTEERGTTKPMSALEIQITEGAEAALARMAEQKEQHENVLDDVPIGTLCTNFGCQQPYEGTGVKKTNCTHHPGAPIFHEGMKYWSCCKSKTSDFEVFMSQKGCKVGEHAFSKVEKVKDVREDWFNSSGTIHLNLYCKGTIPTASKFESNGLTLNVHVSYGNGTKESTLSYDLFGEIVVAESHAKISERKVELVLKQAQPFSWPKLRYEKPAAAELPEEGSD